MQLLRDFVSKPCFSGHETFPFKYGWLKKCYDNVVNFNPSDEKEGNVYTTKDAISRFGVGKNMVSSMRFWSYHIGLIDEKGRFFEDQEQQKIYKKILDSDSGQDPWVEHIATLWLVHWNLIFNGNATLYKWFFNLYNRTSFDKSILLKDLKQTLLEEYPKNKFNDATLKRDIECFLKNYAYKKVTSKKFTEDSIESPLAELKLISAENNDIYRINKGHHRTLPEPLVIYALLQFWRIYFPNSVTLNLLTILNDVGSPGRIFCLSEIALVAILENAHYYFPSIEWSETAGMRQMILKDSQLLKDSISHELEEVLMQSW